MHRGMGPEVRLPVNLEHHTAGQYVSSSAKFPEADNRMAREPPHQSPPPQISAMRKTGRGGKYSRRVPAAHDKPKRLRTHLFNEHILVCHLAHRASNPKASGLESDALTSRLPTALCVFVRAQCE
ncbi:hypothetical protein TNCV_990291 [Trichonephila clavipes]|nr:hypothetical protein TNCV_990291 [Trichonephila clavipes]